MEAYHLFLLVLVYSITNFFFLLAANGFTVKLIHRDSPLSPYYNKSATTFERLERATKRSFNRVKYLSDQDSFGDDGDVTSNVFGIAGEYYMEFYIGSPPYFILATIDTASDLTWTQCNPCVGCSKQINDLFEPNVSSTYQKLHCTTSADCRIHEYCYGRQGCIEDESYCDQNNYCRFRLTYQDKDYSNGELALETFTFKSTTGGMISFPRIKFGCSHINNALEHNVQSGLAGLGGGPSSMISQMDSMLDAKQFSYCLVPLDEYSSVSTSKLNFGKHADVTGEEVVSTPITTNGRSKTKYYLTFRGFSVGGSTFMFIKPIIDGNIMIDSATMLTHLPSIVYEALKSKIMDAIDYEPVDYEVEFYDLCYEDLEDIKPPNITFSFKGGDIILQPFNTFLQNVMHKGIRLRCLTIVPIKDGSYPVFGTFAQTNFAVKYDLENWKVSFKPTDCTIDPSYI
ncbi:Peptidase A1 [Macleaya cordata]|uniref:Peptidase A1 n=1 Tax=Macleaya cordata TaxID=56857 RepID=A0A200R6U7_MACCD|nr:Peptidase A1 [Macleaya cordata]